MSSKPKPNLPDTYEAYLAANWPGHGVRQDYWDGSAPQHPRYVRLKRNIGGPEAPKNVYRVSEDDGLVYELPTIPIGNGRWVLFDHERQYAANNGVSSFASWDALLSPINGYCATLTEALQQTAQREPQSTARGPNCSRQRCALSSVERRYPINRSRRMFRCLWITNLRRRHSSHLQQEPIRSDLPRHPTPTA